MRRIFHASLISTTALLFLVGCQPPDVRREVIVIKSLTAVKGDSQVTHIVRKGSTIVWVTEESDKPFYIRFTGNVAACGQNKDWKGYYYMSEIDKSRPHYPNTLTCTIDVDDSKVLDLGYGIYDGPPLPEFRDGVTPCGGCNEGTNPNAGK